MPPCGHCKPLRIPEETITEILALYEQGHGLFRLCAERGYSSRDYTKLRELLRQRGYPILPAAEASRRRKGVAIDLSGVSPERWQELYWAPGCGYPSLGELARRFGVSAETVRYYLHRAGITVRSHGDQLHLEIAAGRLVPHHRAPGNPERLVPAAGNPKGARRPSKAVALSAATRRRAIPLCCQWCGLFFERKPSQVARGERHYCCLAHSAADRAHRARHGEAAPRPLLLSALRDRLGRSAATFERLEEKAAAVGAGEPEILALIMERRAQ